MGFIVATGLDCRLPATIYTRVSQRDVLLWIQEVTDTQPVVMVVGGFTSHEKGFLAAKDRGTVGNLKGRLTNDVELISYGKSSKSCSKAVKPIIRGQITIDGKTAINEFGFSEDIGDASGMTGRFAKESPIVCGGKNGFGNLKECHEFDYRINKSHQWWSLKMKSRMGILLLWSNLYLYQ